MRPVPGARSQEGIDAVASYHTLSSEVGKVAAEAGAKLLMLNHFVPAEFDRQALAAEVARDFDGPFAIGEDLMSRSEEHTSELQSLMRISYAVFCLKKKKQTTKNTSIRL